MVHAVVSIDEQARSLPWHLIEDARVLFAGGIPTSARYCRSCLANAPCHHRRRCRGPRYSHGSASPLSGKNSRLPSPALLQKTAAPSDRGNFHRKYDAATGRVARCRLVVGISDLLSHCHMGSVTRWHDGEPISPLLPRSCAVGFIRPDTVSAQ